MSSGDYSRQVCDERGMNWKATTQKSKEPVSANSSKGSCFVSASQHGYDALELFRDGSPPKPPVPFHVTTMGKEQGHGRLCTGGRLTSAKLQSRA
jgi:hypothetical protein